MTPRLPHDEIYLFPILLCLVRSRSGSGWSVFGPLEPAIIKTPLISSLILVVIILFIITILLLILRFIVVIILIVDVIVVVTSIRSRGSRGRGSCMRIIRG